MQSGNGQQVGFIRIQLFGCICQNHIRRNKVKRELLRVVVAIALSSTVLTGCTPQTMAKNYGGEVTIELKPNQKLEEITWKDDSLWYLTRPMTENDVAETHTFQQSTDWGVFEGTVIIVENKK